MKTLLFRSVFAVLLVFLCTMKSFADVVIVCNAQGQCQPVVIFGQQQQQQPYMANTHTGQWVYPQ